jgi:hypothetical protein
MQKLLFYILFFLFANKCVAQSDDSINRLRDTTQYLGILADSLSNDTQVVIPGAIGKSLLEQLQNRDFIRNQFYPFLDLNEGNNREIIAKPNRGKLPNVKELDIRKPQKANWRFWIICFILLYIAFVRIANTNNFKVFILSVFNLKLSSKIWEEQRYTFTFTTIQLFAIYIMIGSLFISGYLEMNFIQFIDKPVYQYFVIVVILFLVYFIKFSVHTLLGSLLKIKKLAISFVANTVSVNNFLALVIFPFIIFFTYNRNPMYILILSQVVISIFFIGVAYRLVRIFLLSGQFIQLPKFYLFIYLCALEVLPWFVIIHFINNLRI